MTIIVAVRGVMVADSGESQGGIIRRVARPKIFRNDAGWLAAWAGGSDDGSKFERWFMEGMTTCSKPALESEHFAAILMAPDGQVWRVNKGLERHLMAEPVVCGEETVEAFTFGAMMAGADAVMAVELACQHCAWAAGPVQVERIGSLVAEPPRRVGG